jgi:hypothetical protein
MEMLEDYIISMKSNAKDVCHTLGCWWLVLRLGNFKMPVVAMETAKTLNLTRRWITTLKKTASIVCHHLQHQ